MKTWFLVALDVVSLEGSFAAMTVESQEYDMEKVNEVYQRWAKYRDVDVEALRGDYFYPSAFWQRPIEDVLDDLRPELQKCVIPGMSEPRLNPFPCFPVCPRDKLLETEQLLEDAICNKIEVLMAKKLLDFDRNEYLRSNIQTRQNKKRQGFPRVQIKNLNIIGLLTRKKRGSQAICVFNPRLRKMFVDRAHENMEA